MTPLELFEREQRKLAILLERDIDPITYFKVDHGHTLLLVIAGGIQALQAYCLASAGSPVIIINSSGLDP